MAHYTPTPHEPPVLRWPAVRRDARRPLIVFGDLGRPDPSDGMRPVERITQIHNDVYLGPLIGQDGQSFETQISDLMVWRVKAAILGMAGIVVPQWEDLVPGHRDLVLHASRDWLYPSGPVTRLADAPTAEIARLPVSFVRRGRLVEVTRYQSGHRPQSLRTMLESMAPTAEALSTEVVSVAHHPHNARDFDAACRVAAELQASGRSGVWISKYLTAYGYENSRQVPGAWHHARLIEALPAGAR